MGKPTELGGKLAGAARGLAKRLEGYKGIFRRLAEDHGEVSLLIQRVRHSPEDADARRELFPRIRRELVAHARAEEQEFYTPLRRFLETRAILDRSTDDHRRLEALLEQLAVADSSTPAWTESFAILARIVEDHVEEEEHRLFPLACDLVSDAEAVRMEERFRRTKDAVRHQLS